jgi:hypothetical protein
MSQVMMIRSLLNQHVIDIDEKSAAPGGPVFPAPGAGLDAYHAKSGGLSLEGPPPALAANQSWHLVPDPAGSSHFVIQNPASGNCIDIRENSVSRGAALDAFGVKKSDNRNQLWDLLPDPFGSGGFFVQNPQTGFVIEIPQASDTDGVALVVNPRRLFDCERQLWTGIVAGGAVANDLPLLTSAKPPFATLIGSGQYALAPAELTQSLTSITVTIDIIEDLVAESFSVQINCTPPSPFKFHVNWLQFGLVMQNNSLVLFTQVWDLGHKPPGFTGSFDQSSSSMLGVINNTIPWGTRIVLSLSIDSKESNFATAITGSAFNASGAQIGTTVTWSAIGRTAFSGSQVQESDLSPIQAFQVVVVGPPSGTTVFSAGQGTITVAAKPDISAQSAWPGAAAGITGGTGEQSNIFYGLVQNGQHPLIAQPFGVPSPKITPTGAPYSFTGAGLYPNSKLIATSAFAPGGGDLGSPVAGVLTEFSPTAAPDGSFSLAVAPKNESVVDDWGTTVAATVTDAFGNWAQCSCVISGWPHLGLSQQSGTSKVVH